MANVIKEGGLRLKSSAVDQPLETCFHASDDTARLGVGDPVKTSTAPSVRLSDGSYRQAVALCASGDRIYGVVVGVAPLSAASSGFNLDRRHCPASTLMTVLVRPCHASDVYAISEDGTLALASVSMCADITGNGGSTTVTECNSVSGMSTVMLDTSTAQAGTGQLKIIGFEAVPDNTPASANASILVRVNEANLVGVGADGV